MKIRNKTSKYKGVALSLNKNTGTIAWLVRIERKDLKFKRRFPFTDRGEELAGITYQNKINELYTKIK